MGYTTRLTVDMATKNLVLALRDPSASERDVINLSRSVCHAIDGLATDDAKDRINEYRGVLETLWQMTKETDTPALIYMACGIMRHAREQEEEARRAYPPRPMD